MADVNDGLKQIEFEVANSSYALTDRGLRFLLDNYITVMTRRGITSCGGIPLNQWATSFHARIGIEPLFRLLWVIIRDTINQDIPLHEVLIADPGLFLDCLANDDLLPFYERFPQ